MKKLAVFGLIIGIVSAAIVMARKRQAAESPEERAKRQEKKRRAMFVKMQEGMEAMPEDFPPVVMFDNVAATRENSERILELLEKDPSSKKKPAVAAAK
jgi:hypothetical protein